MTDERTTREPSTVTEAVATATPTGGSTCSSDEFQCGDGTCIPLSQRCDWTEYHCQDGTDEFDCRTFHSHFIILRAISTACNSICDVGLHSVSEI